MLIRQQNVIVMTFFKCAFSEYVFSSWHEVDNLIHAIEESSIILVLIDK